MHSRTPRHRAAFDESEFDATAHGEDPLRADRSRGAARAMIAAFLVLLIVFALVVLL